MSKYVDPLHIDPEQLVVYHKGKPAYRMNKRLLDQQNCWTNLDAIKEAHVRKLDLYDALRATDDNAELRKLGDQVTAIEFELQGLWKFTLDYKFHRFWEYPKCQCPKMDNADSYPYQQYISGSCPLHALNFIEKQK